MSYLSWHVGMNVALREGAPVGLYAGWNYPQHGCVYTIRAIFKAHIAGCVCLRLTEVNNPEHEWGNGAVYEPGFKASWFRPVQTRKTDISIFTAMLHDQRQKVPA